VKVRKCFVQMPGTISKRQPEPRKRGIIRSCIFPYTSGAVSVHGSMRSSIMTEGMSELCSFVIEIAGFSKQRHSFEENGRSGACLEVGEVCQMRTFGVFGVNLGSWYTSLNSCV